MHLRNQLAPVVGALLVLAGLALGQDPRGALRGVVTDQSKAVIPNVEVRATNVATGVTVSAQTNEAGSYSIPFLPSAIYDVSAELQGFKKFVQAGVQIRVAETTELNIAMDVGTVAETLEVNEATPLLDTASSSLGQVIDERRILELPLAAGNPLELVLLTPGMVEPSKFLWKAAWNFRNVTSDGNPAYTTEYTIDGVSNTFAEGNLGRSRYAFAPPATAIREVKMQTAAYDASVGHTLSSVVNVATISGTNSLHGEAHWTVRNQAFDAPNFFNNKNKTLMPVYQDNRYGASAGGPVLLPKLYNGKNRTFWHYTWEANKWKVPQTFTGTVPTEAQRRGDFSGLLAINNSYQIYDPLTIAVAPNGRFSRQPLAGNVIPASRLDPVGLNLAKLYPAANQPGTIDGRNNFFNGSNNALEDYYAHLVRLDHAFTENHRAFIRLHYDWWQEDKDRRFGPENPANGIILERANRGIALDDVIVLGPTLVLNIRYGLTHQDFLEQRTSRGFNLTSLGFSSALAGLVDSSLATIPNINAGSYSAISRWESGDGATTSMTHSLVGNFDKLHGAHSLKFGADYRNYRANNNRFPQAVSPVLTYSSYWTHGPLDNSPSAQMGQELASMLFGIPGGGMERTASFAMQDQYFGLYIHDGWKLSRHLTVNLGLRYEIETPVTERFDRLVAGYDFTTPNPVDAQARANYARSPIPELPVSQFRALGGLTWVNQGGNGRSPFQAEKNNFMPRIGLAWQLLPNTVFRAGYGIYYDTIGVNATLPIQTGFTQGTPIQASLDEGLTYVANNANPFPAGLLNPLGPAGGLRTNLAQNLGFYDPNRSHPYSQRWSGGLQQLLPGQFLADVSYVASRAVRLGVSRSVNDTPAQYLSTLPVRDQQTINYLSQTFPNPFSGTNPLSGTSISRAALLRPYPQFGRMSRMEPIGYSWYHSLQLRAEKRFSRGYTFQLGYTWSKLMEATSFLNDVDPMPYEVIGGFDRTHRLTMSGIWEVPFGKGRQFGAKLPAPVNFFAGGWQISGLVVRQGGAPLGFGNVIFNGDLHNIALPKSERTVDRWLNPDAGFNRVSTQQLSSNLRTFPLRLSGVRGDGRATWDFSAIKNFPIREQVSMQFRADVYNAWNHANLNNPNTSPVSSAFGRITGAAEGRNWQFGLRLKF
ncbi:MAG: TonB-dependent receptor [Acidobacteria bacterium]|nr:TonB-dependent receptor [Acidobacteriota bacterium]